MRRAQQVILALGRNLDRRVARSWERHHPGSQIASLSWHLPLRRSRGRSCEAQAPAKA